MPLKLFLLGGLEASSGGEITGLFEAATAPA
jgi:hypothetical protein